RARADDVPVRRVDRADPDRRRYRDGASRGDRVDPGHLELLQRLASLSVEFEIGVVGLHREQVGPSGDLGADQIVEADLVTNNVAEPDLADLEDDRTVAGGEVMRL